LTPASRRQDHTTTSSASALFDKSAIRVHRIPSRVRDYRERPFGGRDEIRCSDLLILKIRIFFKMSLTGVTGLIRLDKSVFRRKSATPAERGGREPGAPPRRENLQNLLRPGNFGT